jgi:hypothetical protein
MKGAPSGAPAYGLFWCQFERAFSPLELEKEHRRIQSAQLKLRPFKTVTSKPLNQNH